MKPTASTAHAIRVLVMSPDGARRLREAPGNAGRVHSVFEHALNLCWHDGRLLTLHGPGRLRAPFAVALARFPIGAVQSGVPVQRRDETIVLDDVVTIEWRSAVTNDTAMPYRTDGSSATASLMSALPPVECGGGLSSVVGLRACARLADGLRRGDASAFVDGALSLLGLGEGLTPAGDDCLVGALAVVHRLAGSWLHAHPDIQAIVAGAAATATTDVAREFVMHALAGHFAENLIDLMTAPSPEEIVRAATTLLQMGATSGADTLRGVRLALAALDNREGGSACRL